MSENGRIDNAFGAESKLGCRRGEMTLKSLNHLTKGTGNKPDALR
jgi:hypothetical protein